MNSNVETEYAPIQPSRQIDQMLMQTRAHHVNLSSMADLKANIMLTLAALIVTFSIGYLDNPILRWPVTVMIFFCVITILAAAYAVMIFGVLVFYNLLTERLTRRAKGA